MQFEGKKLIKMENFIKNLEKRPSALKPGTSQPDQSLIEVTKAKRHLDNNAYEHAPHMQDGDLVADKYAKATPNYNPTNDSTEIRSHRQRGNLLNEMKKARERSNLANGLVDQHVCVDAPNQKIALN